MEVFQVRGCTPHDHSGSLFPNDAFLQDDRTRWYGELLHLCKSVVAAMHENECRVSFRYPSLLTRFGHKACFVLMAKD